MAVCAEAKGMQECVGDGDAGGDRDGEVFVRVEVAAAAVGVRMGDEL